MSAPDASEQVGPQCIADTLSDDAATRLSGLLVLYMHAELDLRSLSVLLSGLQSSRVSDIGRDIEAAIKLADEIVAQYERNTDAVHAELSKRRQSAEVYLQVIH